MKSFRLKNREKSRPMQKIRNKAISSRTSQFDYPNDSAGCGFYNGVDRDA